MFWADRLVVLLQKCIYILIMFLNVFLSVDFYKSYVQLEIGSEIVTFMPDINTRKQT